MTYPNASASASATATVCDNLATFGGAPERDELDSRPIWDVDCHHSSDHALAGTHSKTAADIFASSMAAGVIQEIMDLAAEHLTSDGTQLADEREPLLWGFVNVLHVDDGKEARLFAGVPARGVVFGRRLCAAAVGTVTSAGFCSEVGR